MTYGFGTNKLGHHSLGQIERQLTDEVRHDKTSPLRMAWDRLQTDPVRRDEHSTLIRERRLVAIVTMLELVNLSKLIVYDIASQGKDDAKTYWSLAASGMTIAAGVADMTGLSIKYLLNDKAVSFSRLKLFSGGMAVGATWIGAFFDYMDFGAESSRGRSTLASLYLLKSAVGFGLGVVTFAASATFAPNIARRILLNRVSASTIEQFSKKTSKLLLARLVGATVGTWITAGLMVTQALIIALDDDALEKWCKNSPFGLEAAGENAFKDAEKMHQSLEAAIYDVK